MKKIIPVLLLAVILCSCGSAKNENVSVDDDLTPLKGGEVRLFCDHPDTLNPIVTGYKSISSVMYTVYDGLFRVENDFSAVPVLSTGYTADNGNTRYVVRLKKDVKFHDGTTFGAEDVIATLDNIRSTQSIYNFNLRNVASYGVQDDGSVVFNLLEPQSNFANMLDFPILSSEVKSHDYIAENNSFYPNGTGKFKVEALRDDCLLLSANKDYHGGDTFVDSVKISYIQNKSVAKYSFEAMEVDMITTDLYAWGDTSMAGDFTTNEYESNRLTFLGFNCQNIITSDSNVRRAISYAIDKSQVVDKVMYSHGAVVDSPVNPNSYFADHSYIKDNFEQGKAREMLKENGWLDFDGDGILDKYFDDQQFSMSFNLIVNADNVNSVQLANYLSENLINEGIEINVVELDYNGYLGAISNGEFDMFIGRVDISNDCNLSFMLESSGAQNYFGYLSSEMDGALYNINIATDSHSIRNAYKAFDDTFKNEYPFIPLYFETDAVFLSSRIKGDMGISRTGVFTGLEKIFVNYEK